MMISKPDMVKLAKQIAEKHTLPPDVVMGLIERESSWDPYTIRYEPGFQAEYVNVQHLDPTATVSRSMSWGLAQIMGQTAREFGYYGPFPALCEPENGIEWGCVKLAHEVSRHPDMETALLAYNGGKNAGYGKEVLFKAAYYRNSNLA